MTKPAITALIFLSACTVPPGSAARDPNMPSQLNFAYCERIAEETRRSGKLNYNLCPGFMPDGYWIEIG